MLVSVQGIYQDGQIKLLDKVPFEKETKVIVTFLEETEVVSTSKRLTMNSFSFGKARQLLKDYKGSLSDSVLEERRQAQ